MDIQPSTWTPRDARGWLVPPNPDDPGTVLSVPPRSKNLKLPRRRNTFLAGPNSLRFAFSFLFFHRWGLPPPPSLLTLPRIRACRPSHPPTRVWRGGGRSPPGAGGGPGGGSPPGKKSSLDAGIHETGCSKHRLSYVYVRCGQATLTAVRPSWDLGPNCPNTTHPRPRPAGSVLYGSRLGQLGSKSDPERVGRLLLGPIVI